MSVRYRTDRRAEDHLKKLTVSLLDWEALRFLNPAFFNSSPWKAFILVARHTPELTFTIFKSLCYEYQ